MKFNHSMTKEQKAEYARQWRQQRKNYVPQECIAINCTNVEYRRNHCAVHYVILNAHCDKRLYNIWLNMKSRCDNPKNPRYKDYGGRGIAYQPSWAYFINFYIDMHKTYDPALTLDRQDNEKGYSSDNCRWATTSEQQNNRRNNHSVTFNGTTKNMAQWIREVGFAHSLVYQRISYGWTELQALGLEVHRG